MDAAYRFGYSWPELGELSGFDPNALAGLGPGILRPVVNEGLLDVGRLAGIELVEGRFRLRCCHAGFGSAYQNASGRLDFIGHLP